MRQDGPVREGLAVVLKKINGPLAYGFPAVRLWLDDLEQIHEILRGEDGENRTLIESDQFSADLVADLAGIPQERVGTISLACYRDEELSMALNIGKPNYLVALKRDEWSLGVLARLRDLLHRRHRKIYDPPVGVVSFLVPVLAAVVALPYLPPGNADPWLVAGIFAFGAILGSAFGWVWGALQRSVVIVRYRVEMPSWWKRNRDRLSIAVIGVLLGAIASAVIAKQ